MSATAGESRKPGPKSSDAERTLRDVAIMQALHAGEQVKDVAARYELTTRQVRKIAQNFRLRPTGIEKPPMELVERILRQYEQQMQAFSAMAAANVVRMPAVAISALKGYADSLERYRELLSDIGKLPDNLEVFKTQTEVERLGERVLLALEDVAKGEISAVEAQELVEAYLRERARVVDSDQALLPRGEDGDGDG